MTTSLVVWLLPFLLFTGVFAAPFLNSNETGVVECTFALQTDAIGELKNKTTVQTFSIYVLLRYMAMETTEPGLDRVRIQAVAFPDAAELPCPPPPPPPSTKEKHKNPFDPPAIQFNPHFKLYPSSNTTHPGYDLAGSIGFPLGPVVSSAPSYLEASFTTPSSWGHEYTLQAYDGGEGQTCTFHPAAIPNRLDPRGIRIDTEPLRADSRQIPKQAAVVIKPLFNIKAEVAAALIDRHLQHYATLGFTKYIVNVLPADLEPLLLQPRIIKWVLQGLLLIIKWDAVPEHPGKVLWDQRVVYTHAVLSHLGTPTYLLMSDLDEYMVAIKPGPKTVYEMVQECTGPQEDLVNLQLTRFHVIAKDWPNRTVSEQALWLTETTQEHPILQYHLINLHHPPYWKSMVNPNFIKVFFVHVATAYQQYNATRPDPQCMALAHCTNINSGREHQARRIADRYKAHDTWVAALDRLSQQRKTWLMAGASAEPTTTQTSRALALR